MTTKDYMALIAKVDVANDYKWAKESSFAATIADFKETCYETYRVLFFAKDERVLYSLPERSTDEINAYFDEKITATAGMELAIAHLNNIRAACHTYKAAIDKFVALRTEAYAESEVRINARKAILLKEQNINVDALKEKSETAYRTLQNTRKVIKELLANCVDTANDGTVRLCGDRKKARALQSEVNSIALEQWNVFFEQNIAKAAKKKAADLTALYEAVQAFFVAWKEYITADIEAHKAFDRIFSVELKDYEEEVKEEEKEEKDTKKVTYDRSKIMKQAWAIYRANKDSMVFGDCIRRAWAIARGEIVDDMAA